VLPLACAREILASRHDSVLPLRLSSWLASELGDGTLKSRVYTVLSGILVYGCVLLAQIFFRSDSVDDALSTLADMLNVPGLTSLSCWPWSTSQCFQPVTLQTPLVGSRDLAFLAVAMAIAWPAPNTQEIMASYGRPILARIDTRRWAFAFGVVLFLGLVSIRDGQPFIYFQF
jgi:alginate O-acetyltransferase complex protein AlgI